MKSVTRTQLLTLLTSKTVWGGNIGYKGEDIGNRVNQVYTTTPTLFTMYVLVVLVVYNMLVNIYIFFKNIYSTLIIVLVKYFIVLVKLRS